MKIFKIALAFMFFAVGPAFAEVSFFANVSTEAEAENSALAKEEALTKAQREAFLEVAGRLTSEDNVRELDKLTDEQLQNFVMEVSVVDEKSGVKNYQANLNIEINGTLLKQYMQENDMVEVATQPLNILIIPVYTNNVKSVWEDGNIWRQAWLDKGQIKSGSMNFKVIPDLAPYHDLINSDNPMLTTDTYRQLAEAEKIEQIEVVTAVQAGRNTLVLIINSFPGGKEKRIPVFSETGETADRAIAETISYLVQNLRDQQIFLNRAQTQIAVSYEYPNLKTWVATEQKLKKIPQIKSLETGAIGNGKVTFRIDYAGSYDQLLKALEEAELTLTVDNGLYTLK